MQFYGIAASPGITHGKVLVIDQDLPDIVKKTAEDSEAELKKLTQALTKSKADLENIREQALKTMGADKAAIFVAHLMVLDDPELLDQTMAMVKNDKVNVEWAFKSVADSFVAVFESLHDEYMRERAADIKDVSTRVIHHLYGKTQHNLATLSEEVILVARDLTPSQTATMNREMVLGFLTDVGGMTSHSAIMARTMETPAIVGLQTITKQVQNGDLVAFDGHTGEVFLRPDAVVVKKLNEKKQKDLEAKTALNSLIGKESVTLDGHHVELAGNIGSPNDLKSLIANDAEAIGLYRTEFVFMDRTSMPSEEEQYGYYSKVLSGFSKNTIIRTLDIGGDKQLEYLKIPHEMNPFLGYRAIRICLQDEVLFKTQLRALLRASVHGKLSLMFPMISSLEEFLEAKAVVDAVKTELTEKQIPYSKDIKLGIMIEVPSAALISDILADHVDFFSIGTNDLTQYTCAVDRMNEKISKLYNPFSPGLLRLIAMVIKNGKAKNKMVGICGSMAHKKELVPLFLGLGLYEFSMSPMHILETRKLIRSLKFSECSELAEHILKLGTASEIQLTLEKFIAKKVLNVKL